MSTLSYGVDSNYVREKGDGFCHLLKEWLSKHNIDVLVYCFDLDDNASIIIECEFEKRVEKSKIGELAEVLFDRFNIKYNLEEESDY